MNHLSCSYISAKHTIQQSVLCVRVLLVAYKKEPNEYHNSGSTRLDLVNPSTSHLIPVADRCHAVGMAGCGHSKIARVRAYYLYCMCLAVLTSV